MPDLYDSVRPAFRKLPQGAALQAQKRFDELQRTNPFTGYKLGLRVMGLIMAFAYNRHSSEWGKHTMALRAMKKRWGALPHVSGDVCTICGSLMRKRGIPKTISAKANVA